MHDDEPKNNYTKDH